MSSILKQAEEESVIHRWKHPEPYTPVKGGLSIHDPDSERGYKEVSSEQKMVSPEDINTYLIPNSPPGRNRKLNSFEQLYKIEEEATPPQSVGD